VQSVLAAFLWLSSINTAFWLLAQLAGALVSVLQEFTEEFLWEILATLYNLALAVLFSAIMFLSASRGVGPGSLRLREMCGFVLLYIALGAAYTDPDTRRMSEHSKPGYAAGLAAYLFLAAAPTLADRPELLALYAVLKALAQSWVGWVLTVAMTFALLRAAASHGLLSMFRILAPAFWTLGLLKHPPIRVRRRRD
jgi:hypothetical protein